MNDDLDLLVSQFGERQPYDSEAAFFKKRPEVAGMAADDNRIVMNPHSKLAPEELQAVRRNEALRIYMRQNPLKSSFDPTDAQRQFFNGSEYASNPQAMRETIVARIITGDPSIGEPSAEQIDAANALRQQIQSATAARRSLAPQATDAARGLATHIDNIGL